MKSSRRIHPLIGVRPEKVTLGLGKIGGQALPAIGIKIGQGYTQAWHRQAPGHGLLHHSPPIGLAIHDFPTEIVVYQEVGQLRIFGISRTDILQQRRPYDTAAPPDAGHRLKIQIVLMGSGGPAKQRQPLGIGGHRGGIQGIFDLLNAGPADQSPGPGLARKAPGWRPGAPL